MKYNKTEIMRNAWRIRKTYNVSMSVAMKAAWAVAKAVAIAEQDADEYCGNYRTSVNDWAKYGKARCYIASRWYTNAWALKRERKIGFVDLTTGEFVAA